MVYDVEREWIAEECRTNPQPPSWLWLILMLAVGAALWEWLN
jgi:hypothetical protein